MILLGTFEYEDLKVELFYAGTNKLPCKVYLKNKLVYEDNSYRPSPLYCIDAPESMVGLLGFVTVNSDGVGPEFFEERGADKALEEWANGFEAEQLRTLISDFDQSDDESFLKEYEMTREQARSITKYIKWV